MRTRKHLAGIATLGVAALAAGSAFGAGGGITVVKHTTATSANASVRAAKCDKGDQVLGGGFSSTDDSGALAQQSYPVKGDRWKVETLGNGPPASGTTTAIALCQSSKARDLMVVSKRGTIPAGTNTPDNPGEGAVKAKCPKGWKVLSGGYADKPPYRGGLQGQIAIDTSKRTDARTWKVHGGNEGVRSDVQAFAICAKAGATRVAQVANKDSSSDGDETATAECLRGERLVGGGFQVKPDQAHGIFPQVAVSQPQGKAAWLAHWTYPVMKKKLVAESLTSYAECER